MCCCASAAAEVIRRLTASALAEQKAKQQRLPEAKAVGDEWSRGDGGRRFDRRANGAWGTPQRSQNRALEATVEQLQKELWELRRHMEAPDGM